VCLCSRQQHLLLTDGHVLRLFWLVHSH
jgi:hypothetical protein